MSTWLCSSKSSSSKIFSIAACTSASAFNVYINKIIMQSQDTLTVIGTVVHDSRNETMNKLTVGQLSSQCMMPVCKTHTFPQHTRATADLYISATVTRPLASNAQCIYGQMTCQQTLHSNSLPCVGQHWKATVLSEVKRQQKTGQSIIISNRLNTLTAGYTYKHTNVLCSISTYT